MILFKCDRCGKAIAPYVYRIGFEGFKNTDYMTKEPVNAPWVHPEDPDYVADNLSEKVYARHLCRQCVEQIAEMILAPMTEIFEGGYRPHTMRSRFRRQSSGLSRQRY